MKFKEVEILLDKDITNLPLTAECPTCGVTVRRPEYKCVRCATQIIFIEEEPRVILD